MKQADYYDEVRQEQVLLARWWGICQWGRESPWKEIKETISPDPDLPIFTWSLPATQHFPESVRGSYPSGYSSEVMEALREPG